MICVAKGRLHENLQDGRHDRMYARQGVCRTRSGLLRLFSPMNTVSASLHSKISLGGTWSRYCTAWQPYGSNASAGGPCEIRTILLTDLTIFGVFLQELLALAVPGTSAEPAIAVIQQPNPVSEVKL
jgi:hypothetical protein